MKLTTTLIFACIGSALFAKTTFLVGPPDSTSNIIEKTSAHFQLEEGKNLYNEGKTRDALNKFREAATKDITNSKAPFWIARCHYDLNNYGYALRYSRESIRLNKGKIEKEMYEILAETYHRTGILDTAIIHYEHAINALSKTRATELQLHLKLAQARYAQSVLQDNTANLRKNLGPDVNSGFNDYSPVLCHDHKVMYFTGRRNNTTGGKVNPYDQNYFEDIYRVTWNDASQRWDSLTNRLGRINGDGFESISHVSEDGSIAYITINNEAVQKAKIKTGSSDIAEVKWTNQNQWSAPKLIPALNSSFYDGNATVTADGNSVYFISERNAEKSMSDIYYAQRQGRNWSRPVALPKEINSKGRETTPYITPDGRYLFFSSNGREDGMGAYDVYVVERLSPNTWGPVKNLGPVINTVNDDFGFKIYTKINKAYINGIEIVGDKASIDIYDFDISLEDLLKDL